uniref:Uncharacterized protein n=1 Tax=Glossina palpalis gambiensis TaxID=67801 RepID=A0A1B0AUT3_9MUSC
MTPPKVHLTAESKSHRRKFISPPKRNYLKCKRRKKHPPSNPASNPVRAKKILQKQCKQFRNAANYRTMEFAKNITLGFLHGFWDSIKGMTFVFYIDAEIAEQERQNRMRRSPSPVPSSASAMILEQERQRDFQRENPDERNLNSLRNRLTEPRVAPQEKKIAQKVFMCCVLNGGFTWMSIILFEHLLLPTLKFLLTLCYGKDSDDLHLIWSWLQSILSIIFGMMWVLPIFLLMATRHDHSWERRKYISTNTYDEVNNC